MTGFSLLDWLALAFFALGWLGYQFAAERTSGRRSSLNVLMNEQRRRWMQQMVVRDNRVFDVLTNAGIQNGTAFFASTSLLAVGAALVLLHQPTMLFASSLTCPSNLPQAESPGS